MAVPDGNYEITFRIFDAETSGTELWEEKQTVAVDNGVVSANLGSVTEFPSSLDFNSAIWLEIQVNGDAPMTPRRKVLAVPSALNADTVDGFHASQTPTANQIPVVNSSGTLALTGGVTVGSHILPSASGSINLGSSSAKFGTIYADTISADSTTISGTDSTAFTINTGQTTNNTDNSQVKFYLGPTLNDHAALQWSGTTSRFELYSRLATNTLADLRVASITASDSLTSAGTLAVTGATTLSSTLDVTDTTTLATLNVSGDATFDSGTLFVDTTNDRVGVGTTSPAAKLHVVTGGSSVSILIGHDATDATRKLSSVASMHYTNAEEPVGLIFSDVTDSMNQVNIGGGRSTLNAATQIGFYTASTTTTVTGTERARLTSDGYFGIGDTSPAALLTVGTNDAFQVTSAGNVSTAGTLAVTGATTLSSTLGVTGATTLSSTLSVSGNTTIGSNSFFVNTSTGRVGIGTNSPQQLLEVSSASDARILVRSTTEAVAGTTTLQFMTGSGAASSTNTTAWIQSTITQADPSSLKGNLIFSTNRGDSLTEAMRIDDAGNVGIGATTIGRTSLDANSRVLTVQTGTANRPGVVELIGNAGANVGSGNPVGVLRFGGLVTGGTYSSLADIRASRTSSGESYGQLFFQTANNGTLSNRMTIDESGNVGIGDTTPAALLTVGSGDLFQVSSAGNVSTAGTLAVTGATSLSSTLAVTGNTNLSGTLSAGATDVTALSVSSAATFGSTLAVTGAATLSSTLGVAGATTLSGTLTVAGNGSASDTDITLGDSSDDQIIINASLAQALVPTGSGTVNLGSAVNRFGTIYADTINYTNSESLSTVSNSLTINSDAADDEDSWLEFYRGGSLTSAKLYWDAANDQFNVNYGFLVQGNTTLGNEATDTTTVRGALTMYDSSSTYKLLFGSATQPGLYRSAANTLALDGNFQLDASGTSDGTTTTYDSRSLTFNGNYWNGSASTDVTGGILLDVTGTTPKYGLALQTGGATRAYFDQAGRLGLGTTDPSARLHIEGSGNTDIYVMAGASNTARTLVGETTTTGQWGGLRWLGSSDSLDLVHSGYSVTDAALSINSSGTVSAAAALSVGGATTLASTLGVTGTTTLSSTLGVTGATTLSSTLGVTGATTLSSTLSVTGVTSLADALTIARSTASGSTTEFITLNNTSTGTASQTRILFQGGSAGTANMGAISLEPGSGYSQPRMRFQTGTTLTDRMVIGHDGAIGFGNDPSSTYIYTFNPNGYETNGAIFNVSSRIGGSLSGTTAQLLRNANSIFEAAYFDQGTTLANRAINAQGTVYIKGKSATSSYAALDVVNSSDTSLLYVRNDGNVGIGDSSPAALLTVGTSDAFQVTAAGNVSTAGTLAVTGNAAFSANVGIGGAATTDPLTVYAPSGDNGFVLKINDPVSGTHGGIDFYKDAGGSELYLAANVSYQQSVGLTVINSADPASLIALNSRTTGDIAFYTANAAGSLINTMRIVGGASTYAGSVVIGESSTISLANAAAWGKVLQIQDGSHVALSLRDTGTSDQFDLAVDNGSFRIYDTGKTAYRMWIDTDGNVGMGTNSPTALLHLAGSRSSTSWTTSGVQLQVAAATLTDTTGSGTIANRVANSFGVPVLASSSATTITAAATVYIAGAPTAGTNTTITNSYALDVNGDIRTRSNNDNSFIISHTAGSNTTINAARQLNISTNAEMTFTTDADTGGGTQRVFTFKGGVANYMTLDRGNLAIGTTTPSARLHVQNITANFSASSWLTDGVGLRIDGVTYTNSSTGAGGTVATAVINSFGQPTIQSSNAITTTHASNVYIAGVPQAGSNQTLTTSSALRIASSAATAGTTSAYSLYVDAPTTATNNYAGYFGGSIVAAMSSYTLNGVTNGAQVFGSSGNAALVARGGTSGTLTIPTTPTSGSLLSSSSVGEVGIVGAATTSAGARTNIGIYGYSYLDQPIASNSSNKAFGGVFIGALGSTTGSSAAMGGQTVGIYAKGDSSAASASTGSTYGVFGWAAGISGETTYGVYGNATGGTINYDLFADNTAGATIALRRNDIAATSGEVIGALSFINNDSQLTTQQSYGKIEIQAAQTISTDAAAGNMLFYTTGTSAGGSPTERMRIRHDGNIGIGATNPGSLLTLSGAAGTVTGISLGTNTDSITASRYIGITNSTDHTNLATNQGFSGIEFGGPSSTDEGYVAIHTHDAGNASGERLRIDKGGNVGIGTGATISAKLQVNAANVGGAYGFYMTANDLTNGRALYASSTSTAGSASGSSYMAVFERSGANANAAHTAYGVYSTVTNTNATSGTNIAGYFSASGATTANYGLIVANGNTGFGTTGPESKVQISGGGLCVGSDADCNTDNNTEGVIYASSTNTTVYDVAENYPTKDKTLTATEIVELDPSNSVFVRRATGTSNHKLLGIISEEPGILLGGFNGNQFRNERQVAVALSGRVRVKMDPASPAVAIGDPLTASTKAGYATKATGSGTIIGRALEPWVPGSGQQLVMTFVQTQYYNPAYEPNFAEELQTAKVITQTIESPAGKNLVINTQQMVVNGRLVVNEAVTVSKTFVTPPSETQKISATSQIQANATKIKVAGDGGAVSLTSTPIIGDAADGQLLIIQGTEDANTVTVKDQSVLDGSNLELGAETRVLGKGDILTLTFDASDSVWYEVSYTDN